jgi:hypothetical protein
MNILSIPYRKSTKYSYALSDCRMKGMMIKALEKNPYKFPCFNVSLLVLMKKLSVHMKYYDV